VGQFDLFTLVVENTENIFFFLIFCYFFLIYHDEHATFQHADVFWHIQTKLLLFSWCWMFTARVILTHIF